MRLFATNAPMNHRNNAHFAALASLGILAPFDACDTSATCERRYFNATAPARHTPDEDRKPRGVDRAAKRAARRKAIAWRGK